MAQPVASASATPASKTENENRQAPLCIKPSITELDGAVLAPREKRGMIAKGVLVTNANRR